MRNAGWLAVFGLVLFACGVGITYWWGKTRAPNQEVASIGPTSNLPLNERMAQKTGPYSPLSEHLSGGDPLYGGQTFNGVLAGVIDEELPIRLKTGEEIARTVLALKIKYLDKNKKVREILLPQILKMGNGEYRSTSMMGSVLEVSISDEVEKHLKNLGTEAHALVFYDSNKVAEAINGASTLTPELRTQALDMQALIDAYEESWAEELSNFVATGDAGQMTFLFGRGFGSSSFGGEKYNVED